MRRQPPPAASCTGARRGSQSRYARMALSSQMSTHSQTHHFSPTESPEPHLGCPLFSLLPWPGGDRARRAQRRPRPGELRWQPCRLANHCPHHARCLHMTAAARCRWWGIQKTLLYRAAAALPWTPFAAAATAAKGTPSPQPLTIAPTTAAAATTTTTNNNNNGKRAGPAGHVWPGPASVRKTGES